MKYIKNILQAVEQPVNIKFKKMSGENSLDKICRREAIDYRKILEVVSKIEKEVTKDGDRALCRLTKKFDGVEVENLLVTSREIDLAEKELNAQLKSALRQAIKNITKFHSEQRRPKNKIETSPGVKCWQEFRPIERVGLYIPGGTAPLFSTLLMLAIPAQLAGCKKIVLCTPPQKGGEINLIILATAKMIGVSEIYKVGGAQAIFAMAQGTKTIPKVDKIFGPGNSYVTAAKMKVSNSVAIDMPAGPSEVLVIANKNSNPRFVASDLLSQAEHGVDSQVALLSTSKSLIKKVLEEISQQLEGLPRKEITKEALKKSFIVLCKDDNEMIRVSNEYAPEHLILQVGNWKKFLNKIVNAGSVFCGEYTPESAGDYASGTNHTLPTGGFAKSFSGVSLDSFGKMITFQQISQQGIKNIGETIEVMAESEGLQAHKNAVTIRLTN